MKARYAGTCAATGKHYPAGTELTKGPQGWVIAGRAAAPAPAQDKRIVRTLAGELRECNINASVFCSACIEAGPGRDAARTMTADQLAPYAMPRTGNDFICAQGHKIHILSDDEVWTERILPTLHLTAGGEMSAKLGPIKWGLVSSMFEYQSYADLAEWHEDMDNFDQAAHYESLGRGGEWTLIRPADAPRVEDLLGILPENRRAVLDVKEAEAAASTQAEEADRKARAADKAARQEAERAQQAADWQEWQAEHLGGLVETYAAPTQTIAWEPAYSYPVWDTNCKRGVAGGQTVYSKTSGTETRYYAPASLADEWIEGYWQALAARVGETGAARLILSLRHEETGVNGGYGTEIPPRLMALHGEAYFVALARQGEWWVAQGSGRTTSTRQPDGSYLRVSTYRETPVAEKYGIPLVIAETVAGSYQPEGKAVAARLAGRYDEEAWGQISQVYRHPRDGRLLAQTYQYRWLDVEAVAAESITRPVDAGWPEADRQALGEMFPFPRYETIRVLREPDGQLFAESGYKDRCVRHEVTDVTPDDLAAAKARIHDRRTREAEAKKLDAVRKQTHRPTIAKVTSRATLDKSERNEFRSGEWSQLEKLMVRHQDAQEETLFLVTEGWWAMGEDGEADEATTVFEDEATARAAFTASMTK